MCTEIICWPDSVEFGGVEWKRTQRELDPGAIEYAAEDRNNGTRMRIYRYPRDREQWLWQATFCGVRVNTKLAHEYSLSAFVDDMELAMACALNAFDDWLDDMQRILREQFPGDRYARGFADGQTDIKSKIEAVLP